MHRLILTAALLIACALAAAAQQKVEPPPVPSAEQQEKITTAVAQANAAETDAAAALQRFQAMQAATSAPLQYRYQAQLEFYEAKARSDVARQQLLTTIYYLMAVLKVSPEEYRPVLVERGLRFEKIVAVKSEKPRG